MRPSRLSEALANAAPGRVAVFRPNAATDLSALPADTTTILSSFKPDVDAWSARGYTCTVTLPDQSFDSAVVIVPRAKALARGMIFQALRATNGGPVWIDGAKTDGIDSIWKDARKRGEISAVTTRDHGRCFALSADSTNLEDWAMPDTMPIEDGLKTAPGVFSADGIDPGSAQLIGALPALKGRVADLGAGWGYLAAKVLAANEAITQLHLIEAEHVALDCARENVTDPRAQFHWQDATKFRTPDPFDHVITNPPFHTGRTGDPALGVAFLTTAAASLRPSGKLWLVANRHLPYEQPLERLFRSVSELGGNAGYKILQASGPVRIKR